MDIYNTFFYTKNTYSRYCQVTSGDQYPNLISKSNTVHRPLVEGDKIRAKIKPEQPPSEKTRLAPVLWIRNYFCSDPDPIFVRVLDPDPL
jgi:hypothetical protein